MNEQRSYFSRALVILMAVMLVFTMMPSMAFAGSTNTSGTAPECPVTVSTTGATPTQLVATATGDTVTDPYQMVKGTAYVYEVAVPAGNDEVTISGYDKDANGESDSFIAYYYTADGTYIGTLDSNGSYGDQGATSATVDVDKNDDGVADYIYVQTPYAKADESDLYASSNYICIIKFVYQLPVTVTIGNKEITTTDTCVKDGYTYQDEWSNDKSDLYVISAEEGTTQVSIKKADDSAFLAYNYDEKGWLCGWYDSTAGVKSVTLDVDHDGDGTADYIRIQNLYTKVDDNNYTGGELQYALQFIVDGGLPVTKEGVTVAALSEREQEAAIKKAVASIAEMADYCTDSDWVTAFYANGGTLSESNQKKYLGKVYEDITKESPSLGTIAKDVIALVAMGYDPQNVTDKEGKSYDLLKMLYNSTSEEIAAAGIYTAPYILLAYDAYTYTLPDGADLATARNKVIDYILSQQASDGSWGTYVWGNTTYPGTAGDTASVAQALLPYYNTNDTAKSGIDKANTFIEADLESSTSSTDYLAYITQYEAMQGKKASELTVDSEAGTDVIDYLLSYKLADNTFEYGTDGKTNKLATIDAFKALVAYKNLTDADGYTNANIYNSTSKYYYGLTAIKGLSKAADCLSDLFIKAPTKLTYKVGESIDLKGLEVTALMSGGTKKTISTTEIKSASEASTITSGSQLSYSGFDTTTAGTKTVTIKYEEYEIDHSVAKTASFVITVNPTDGSSAPKKNTVSLGVYDSDGSLFIKDNSYTIVAGSTTVMDVLKGVLGNAGKTYVLENSGTYIASIEGLGEFDRGENSGWLYKVNGTLAKVAASDYPLTGGESIYWYYTDDWTKDPDAGKWASSGTTTVQDVTTDTKTDVTTATTDVKVTEQTATDGTKEKVATVTVSSANQKEILKQAKANKSKEIVLNASNSTAKDASKVDVNLDKSFVNSIVSDTDAKLTVKTPLGDKTYTQDELKTLAASATGSTITLTIEKTDATSDTTDELDAKAEVAKLTPVARSAKTAKKNIKVTTNLDKTDKAIITELKDAGYTIKYRFYRSTKKSASYKPTLTKSTTTYLNTAGKAGTRYYYKVQIRVYDKDGKLVAKTALKQCKYATRVFG